MKWEKPIMSALDAIGPCHDPECPTLRLFDKCIVRPM